MNNNIIDAKVYETLQKLTIGNFDFTYYIRRITVNKGVYHEFYEISGNFGRCVIDIVDEKLYSDDLKNMINTYCSKNNLKLLRLYHDDTDKVEILVIKFIAKNISILSNGIKLNIAKMIIEKLKNPNINKDEIKELEELIK